MIRDGRESTLGALNCLLDGVSGDAGPDVPRPAGAVRGACGDIRLPGRSSRVVVVDDNPVTLKVFESLLAVGGFDVTAVATVEAAIVAARAGFDAMLLDVRLGAEDGLDVLRTLRSEGITGQVVVLTGFDSEGGEGEVRQLGAEFVDRWTLPDPVELVSRLLTGARAIPESSSLVITPPTLSRWVDVVSRGIDSPADPKTIALWAHAIGRSSSSVREACALARLSAKRSCSLVRVLRAVHLSVRSGRMDPSEWLDVADSRTLRGLLAGSGIRVGEVASLESVLRLQRFVPDDRAIAFLGRALRWRATQGIG